jgi:hypothetical protein
MASFKTKNKKKITYDKRITLEAKHNEIINNLAEETENYENNSNTLAILNLKLKELNKDKKKNINEILSIKDKILEINEIIQKTKSQEIDYFLDNGKLLFDYYETKENVSNKTKTINNIKNECETKSKSKSVMDYFGTKKSNEEVINNTKDNIVNEYFFNTDTNFVKTIKNVNVDFCEKCQLEKILYLSEGKVICKGCGDETLILIDSDKPSYKDPPREVTYFSYQRINHFNECLAQFQAKETTDIPQEVYDKIILELKKERIKDMTKLNSIKIRDILKKLKKNKYYEHIPHIINKLNGVAPPVMSRETEEILRRMFKEIQIPFHKFCPKDRSNFLSYAYVLRKFVELLELDEFIECFSLLKDREKLYEQDKIWKDICKYLDWEFIPSV